jgi:hypothetical protein
MMFIWYVVEYRFRGGGGGGGVIPWRSWVILVICCCRLVCNSDILFNLFIGELMDIS